MMSEKRPFQSLCGWRGIDPTQKVFASQFPALRRVAPRLFGDPAAASPTLLYKAWEDTLGAFPSYPAQQIGDCVSFGHAHGNDLLQCIEHQLGAPLDFRETDTEFIYAASREVAGILGSGDGCYGAAAVKAMTTIGMVSREMLGAGEPTRAIEPRNGARLALLEISRRKPRDIFWARPPWSRRGTNWWPLLEMVIRSQSARAKDSR